MRVLLTPLVRAAGVALVAAGCGTAPQPAVPPPEEAPTQPRTPAQVVETVPSWAADAVFYQIFPERFRNGDPSNDPARASLERPVEGRVPESWSVSPWTGDWYERVDWERALGDDFYEHGVYDRRYGGDLQGVIDRLDYLRELGVNALYLNPVFHARSLHKYDGSSFHHVDPHFGPDPEGDLARMAGETADPATWTWTEADRLFLRLLEEAHARGLRVVIDGVWNHTGRDFFAFRDLREHQERSAFRDWYVVESFDDPATPEDEFRYEGWWGVETLPVFADDPDGGDLHPGPKRYVFDATRRWMDPDGDGDPSDGVDGWRLDVANEVPVGFWSDWNALVRSIDPAAYTVAEVWDDAGAFLARGGFSATMNYHGFAFPVKGYLIDGVLEPSGFARMLDARRTAYAEAHRPALLNLVDSHDTPRLASMIVNAGGPSYEAPERFDYDGGANVSPRRSAAYDVRAPNARERQIQRLVVLFQMTYVGAPMIYYGDEAGMWGADDPDDRMPMVWPDLAYAAQTHDPLGRPRRPDPVAFDRALFDFYRDAVALRASTPALRRGGYDVLRADDERDLFAFSRTLDGEALVVVLNRSEEAHSVRIELPEALRGSYRPRFMTRDDAHRVQQDATALLLELPERFGMVLERGD